MSTDNSKSSQSAAASTKTLQPFRFIHTADIHLDSPLTSLGWRNADLAKIVANATRQVLVRIVNLCLSEKVDALLIAGDLYDGGHTSMKTARFLASQMRRLDEAGIAVFIIRGNHDAESKITRELTLPDSVHVFSSKADSFVIEARETASQMTQCVVIHGASFNKPHAPDSLLPGYKQAVPQVVNIGMMHTSLDGSPQHDPYAPCSLTDLQNHGFAYWALGHIHKRSIYNDPHCTVVMPGIPQGRDIGEVGDKSVTLVTITDDAHVATEEHRLAVAQFELLNISLQNTHEWLAAIELVMQELDRAADKCNADHLVARIVLVGNTTLAWRLRRDTDLFINEIESRLEDDEFRWLDKLIINCDPPIESTDALDNGPQAELYDLMIKEINHSPNLLADAKLTMAALFKSLPSEFRSRFGADDEALDNKIKSLALEGSKQVTANLHTEPAQDEQESS